MTSYYPEGTVRALLDTDAVTEVTRRVLIERLNTPPREPTFFSTQECALLQAVCDRLIPQGDRQPRVDIAGGIDQRLSTDRSNGWRYDDMPPDRDAFKQGLQGIDQSAVALFGHPFQQLSGEQQDTVLKAIQTMEASSGDLPGAVWQSLPADRFFEELLAESVENYYSHPLAQEEIGYVGMADVPTWQRIGLNEREDREPRIVSPTL